MSVVKPRSEPLWTRGGKGHLRIALEHTHVRLTDWLAMYDRAGGLFDTLQNLRHLLMCDRRGGGPKFGALGSINLRKMCQAEVPLSLENRVKEFLTLLYERCRNEQPAIQKFFVSGFQRLADFRLVFLWRYLTGHTSCARHTLKQPLDLKQPTKEPAQNIKLVLMHAA